MTPYIFFSLLGSAVVLGTTIVIGGFQLLKHVATRRARDMKDHVQLAQLKSSIDQWTIKQKAIFVMAVILLGVLLFARTFTS